ncbi:hypothetical protein BGE01nite_44010 [Brevifollis gellanilyticus]|uniref:Uncharacterized protein n=1 Tax=Brevifollis gellanilyticus TaxID=748831 RepID=A0A512MEE3_9BACT|nr:hypothetical protein BGE01nite_44010 [Brevifollis gellanilyticus]
MINIKKAAALTKNELKPSQRDFWGASVPSDLSPSITPPTWIYSDQVGFA